MKVGCLLKLVYLDIRALAVLLNPAYSCTFLGAKVYNGGPVHTVDGGQLARLLCVPTLLGEYVCYTRRVQLSMMQDMKC